MVSTAAKKAAQVVIDWMEDEEATASNKQAVKDLIKELGGEPKVADFNMDVTNKITYVLALMVRAS